MSNPFDFVSDGRKPYLDYQAAEKHPLASMLAVAIPFRILKFQANGGPTDTDWDSLPMVAQRIAEHGDTLLYGGKKGEAARLFCDLVDAIAIMAFGVGGVSILGDHYEVKPDAEQMGMAP